MSHTENFKKISFRPSIKQEEFSLEGKNILETSFFAIVDTIREKIQIDVDRQKSAFFDTFLCDVIILDIVLLALFYILMLIPTSFSHLTAYNSFNFVIQTFGILTFSATTWTGYVYITQSFRSLVKEKIVPPLTKNKFTGIGIYKILPRFFCGTYYQWESGFGFRLFDRTFYSGLFITFMIIGVYGRNILESIYYILIFHNFQVVSELAILFVNIFFISLVFFIFCYTLLTVSAIFFYLFIYTRLFPLEINPLLEMGGTEIFGKFIINCLYLASFTIGMIPFLLLISQIEKIQLPSESFSTVGNVTDSIKSSITQTVREIPVSNISQNFVYLELFFVFVAVAIVIIFSLHYRIKQKKYEELRNLERIINEKKFDSKTEANDKENEIFLLGIYDRIQNLHEWPIKRIFIIEIIFSIVPLLTSLFFF